MSKVKPGGWRPPGRRTAAWAATSLLAVGGLALAGGQHALADSGADPSCTTSTCTVTLASPQVGQLFTVPAGVSSLSVTLYGAVGGSTNQFGAQNFITEGLEAVGAPGGDGAEVTADVDVTPGETLTVDVGGAGGTESDGGTNGGGTGEFGASGGGATDVTSNGTDLLVAGGGGGAAYGAPYWDNMDGYGGDPGCPIQPSLTGGAGGNADSPGGAGQAYFDGSMTLSGGTGGAPGTVAGPGAGGAGGAVSGTYDCASLPVVNGENGNPGSGNTGGASVGLNDIYWPVGSGGGGGGYFGGGAGGAPASTDPAYVAGAGGGGGGGSSYLAPAGSTADTVTNGTIDDTGNSGQVNGGNGEAVITYANPLTVTGQAYATTAGQPLTVDAASGLLSQQELQAPAGETLSIAGPASGQSAQGGTVTVNDDGSFSYTPPAGYTGSDSFSYTVTDGYGDYVTGTATIDVQTAQAISFTAPATGTAGQSATLTATGGGSGNPVTFTVDPSSGTGVCSVSGDTVAYAAAGTCVIDANQAGTAAYAAAAQVTGTIQVQAAQVAPAFTADTPALTAATGTAYSYQFTASGTPAAAYTLGASAPSWLSVNASTGQLTGTPPAGTKSFSYAVTAANAAGSVTAGPFTVTVSSDADIQAGLSCPAGLTVGESGTCTLTVTNAGPALATGVVAGTAALPAQLQLGGCSDACSQLGGLLGWNLGSLPAGHSDTVTFTITAVKTGTAIVGAADLAANPDPNLLNNAAAATVKVTK